MSDSKSYYYMRLKEDFFESDELLAIETMQDGYLYSNILLKLYLRSLKSDGRLAINGYIPYSPEMIANVTRHQVGTVKQALAIFENLGLIEIMPTGVIYMADIQNFIGKSSTEADRKREYRSKIEAESKGLLPAEIVDEDKCPYKCPDKSPPENRDKRLENRVKSLESKDYSLEDRDIDTEDFKHNVESIVSYLNKMVGSSYKPSSKTTQKLIRARMNEGFTVDDFRTVIDNKADEWGKPPKAGQQDMSKYLRPETLFGTKFESYLNEGRVKRHGTGASEHEWVCGHHI